MGGTSVLFATLLRAICLSVVQGIQLDGLPTIKHRLAKSTIMPTTPTTPLPMTKYLYRVNATTGTTCILVRTDCLLNIKYRSNLNESLEADLFLPAYPELSGDCSHSDSESLTMSFTGFTLSMYFKKTPNNKRWYISSMELSYSTKNRIFENIDQRDLNIKLTTPLKTPVLFPTPLGKSYTCDQEQVILMYSPDKNDQSGHVAKLYLRDLRMQCFMHEVSGDWGPPFLCNSSRLVSQISN